MLTYDWLSAIYYLKVHESNAREVITAPFQFLAGTKNGEVVTRSTKYWSCSGQKNRKEIEEISGLEQNIETAAGITIPKL